MVAFPLNVRSLKNDNKSLVENLMNVRWNESFHDDDKCGRARTPPGWRWKLCEFQHEKSGPGMKKNLKSLFKKTSFKRALVGPVINYFDEHLLLHLLLISIAILTLRFVSLTSFDNCFKYFDNLFNIDFYVVNDSSMYVT